MDIKGMVALVTGAGSGLGRETAKVLAEKGAKVALLDRDKENIEKYAKEMNGLPIQCNVVDETEVENAIEKILQEYGVPRICVNCAGIIAAGRVVGREGPMKLESFKKAIDVNVIGTFNVLRLVAFRMSKAESLNEVKERGVIINTSSVAAYEGQIGQAAYSASKGAVASLTLPIARELGEYGIRVVTVAPGLFQTPMMESTGEKVEASLLSNTVFPKRFGYPSEYAQLVCQIVENVMLNGTVIRLDGAIRLATK